MAFSDKSYNFNQMSPKDVVRTVDAHVKEALASDSGRLEIRSDKFTNPDKTASRKSLRDQSITVDTIVLVYDRSLAGPKKQELIEQHLADKKIKGKTIKVIFR